MGLISSTPAAAAPDLADVKSRVDTLYHEAEIASERYHDAKIELDGLQDDLSSLEADEARQDRRLESVRTQVRDAVLGQLEGQSVSAVGQVVVSDDPGAFLSQMSTISAYNEMQQGLFTDYSAQARALGIRSGATARRTEDVQAVEQRLAEEKATIDAKVADAEELLAQLEQEERDRLAAAQARTETVSRGSSPEPAPAETASAPASGRAAAAVAYAMSQVGDAYVYGAAGPDAFDCSGLTMMAWGAAGVALPHSSSAQMSSGSSVSSSALQPGDLVFYYSPVSHVGMYIGNGQIVHAANPGTGVAIAPVFSMPFSGAVRPG